jgi:hypothetical protein
LRIDDLRSYPIIHHQIDWKFVALIIVTLTIICVQNMPLQRLLIIELLCNAHILSHLTKCRGQACKGAAEASLLSSDHWRSQSCFETDSELWIQWTDSQSIEGCFSLSWAFPPILLRII